MSISKRTQVVFKGDSGTSYAFEVYPIDKEFEADSAAIFFITRYNEKNDKHCKIFIGESDDLSRYFNPLCKFSFKEHFKANCICCSLEPNLDLRKDMVQDLRRGNSTLYKNYQDQVEEKRHYLVGDADIVWEVSSVDNLV